MRGGSCRGVSRVANRTPQVHSTLGRNSSDASESGTNRSGGAVKSVGQSTSFTRVHSSATHSLTAQVGIRTKFTRTRRVNFSCGP